MLIPNKAFKHGIDFEGRNECMILRKKTRTFVLKHNDECQLCRCMGTLIVGVGSDQCEMKEYYW